MTVLKPSRCTETIRTIGIPCFVKDDGEVIISMKHYLASSETTSSAPEYASGAACNLDGTGC
ncbi:MAG: hypothetical protein E7112_07330 [Bacteroidales bacterium]|nr:hypothetical protein [Bacteroidales bacterium]